MKKKDIERKYADLLKHFPEGQIPEEDINCYTCKSCGHVTKTKNIHNGVIPFMRPCEKCNEIATSTFFVDIVPEQEHTWEWFRPTLKEILKCPELYPSRFLEHIFDGGLEIRNVKEARNR